MATYFHGNTELQSGGGDGLQTLFLMNPSYIGFSDNGQETNHQQQNHGNGNNNNLVYLPHAPPPHFVGIPLPANSSTAQDQAAGFLPSLQYNLYNLPADAGPERVGQRPPSQGLSLSLSSQQAPYAMPQSRLAGASPPRGEDVRVPNPVSPSSVSVVSSNNGLPQNQAFLGSKYLKAAQELLDEVVSVGKNTEPATNKVKSAAAADVSPGDGGGKRGSELSTVEKQEIQMKKAKLVNMLDEVEQRYRQYNHHMSTVIARFEQMAGLGSAKTYTALALHTISKQFRCLKDAILAQISAASKSLGEEEDNPVNNANDGKIEGSRLKYVVDNQIRQQRALHQLGMIQQHNNAWRPQRGLPERAVSVLRSWLFEHFLHPYPKDSDKIMLAKQTGLTRSQVSNWFINARVRLWKPMVEEMYAEEMNKDSRNKKEDSPSKSAANPSQENRSNEDLTTSRNHQENNNNPIPAIMMPNSPPSFMTRNVKQRSDDDSDILLQPHLDGMESTKFDYGGPQSSRREGFALMGAPTNFIGGFYPNVEMGRFRAEETFQAHPYSGNGGGAVSLTLGLPQGAYQQSFMANQGVLRHETNERNDLNNTNAYETMNVEDRRKRFLAQQLLPNFVS